MQQPSGEKKKYALSTESSGENITTKILLFSEDGVDDN